MKKIFLLPMLMMFSCYSLASNLTDTIKHHEQQTAGRIGVSILNTDSAKIWSFNGDQAFPLMSTFKTLACAKMLYDVERQQLNKNAKTIIKADELISWSPITEKLIGKSITLEQACEATMLMSDNTAANIVLQQIGGPQALTQFIRSIADNNTRLDRIEPELNQAKVGDLRDTTTANAMVKTLNQLLLGNVLSKQSTEQLKAWMVNNKVSDPLLRSVLPTGWEIADRSGAGNNGSRGITAMVWHDNHKPIIISIYMTETNLTLTECNKVIADIGKQIFKTI